MEFINWLTRHETIIQYLWAFTIISTITLYVLCNVLPDRIVGNILPLHNVFKPQTNVNIDFQSIGYAMLHTKWFSRITHYTIFFDAILWFVIFKSWHWSIPALILLIVFVQAFFIGENKFGFWYTLMSIFTLATSALFIRYMGMDDAVLISKAGLMFGGLIRMIGHSAELMPPLLLNRTDQFVKLTAKNINWKVPTVALIGYVAEFASGLPNRLYPVQINYLYQTVLRIRPKTTLSWKEVDTAAKTALSGGYSKLSILDTYYNSVVKEK